MGHAAIERFVCKGELEGLWPLLCPFKREESEDNYSKKIKKSNHGKLLDFRG